MDEHRVERGERRDFVCALDLSHSCRGFDFFDAALRIGAQVETGTFFMNRCDVLDPDLAWTGVKDSGRGCTLSRIGYEPLTRPKSFHLRVDG